METHTKMSKVQMNPALVGSTVVLVANEINVSIFSQLWLHKNEVILEQEFTPETVISPGAVFVPTERFVLTVLPNRLQLQIVSPERVDAYDDVQRVLGSILRLLPHTPFTAIGLNFDGVLPPSAERAFSEWNPAMFAVPALAEVIPADAENRRFGCYFSFDTLGFRAKVDIKPIQTEVVSPAPPAGSPTGQELMLVSCNFHCDLQGEKRNDIALEVLMKWQSVHSKASGILVRLSQ